MCPMTPNLFVIDNQTGSQLDSALDLDPEISPQVKLTLTLRDDTYQHFTLKDLTVYLEYLDRTFGLLSTGNLRSYSHKKHTLRFRTARASRSWELVLDVFQSAENGKYVLLLAWFIARLPNIIEAIPKALKIFEEAKLTREKREQLENSSAADQRLNDASTSTVEDAVAEADQKELSNNLKEIEVYQQLTDDAKLDITASLLATLLKEHFTRKHKFKKAFTYNGVHLENVELTVSPATVDRGSSDERLRKHVLHRINLPIADVSDVE